MIRKSYHAAKAGGLILLSENLTVLSIGTYGDLQYRFVPQYNTDDNHADYLLSVLTAGHQCWLVSYVEL